MENKSNRLAVISIVINIALVIAVIILFIKMPSGPSNEPVVAGEVDTTNLDKLHEKGDNAVMVYYNSDSLNTQSMFVMDLQKEIQQAQVDAEKRLQAKQNELVKWDEAWQKKFPLISTEEQKYMEEGQRKQNELLQLQQQLEQEFFETQNRLTIAGVNRISMYTRDLALANGYDFVVSYQLGGQIVFVNPKMDITSELIQMMNDDYTASDSTAAEPAE